MEANNMTPVPDNNKRITVYIKVDDQISYFGPDYDIMSLDETQFNNRFCAFYSIDGDLVCMCPIDNIALIKYEKKLN